MNLKLQTSIALFALFSSYSLPSLAQDNLPERFLTFKIGAGLVSTSNSGRFEQRIQGTPYRERYVEWVNGGRFANYRTVIPYTYEPININHSSDGKQLTLEANVRLLTFNNNKNRIYSGIRFNLISENDNRYIQYDGYKQSFGNLGLNLTFEHDIKPNLIWAVGISGSNYSHVDSNEQAVDLYTSLLYKYFGIELNFTSYETTGLGRYKELQEKFSSSVVGVNVFFQFSH